MSPFRHFFDAEVTIPRNFVVRTTTVLRPQRAWRPASSKTFPELKWSGNIGYAWWFSTSGVILRNAWSRGKHCHIHGHMMTRRNNVIKTTWLRSTLIIFQHKWSLGDAISWLRSLLSLTAVLLCAGINENSSSTCWLPVAERGVERNTEEERLVAFKRSES